MALGAQLHLGNVSHIIFWACCSKARCECVATLRLPVVPCAWPRERFDHQHRIPGRKRMERSGRGQIQGMSVLSKTPKRWMIFHQSGELGFCFAASGSKCSEPHRAKPLLSQSLVYSDAGQLSY